MTIDEIVDRLEYLCQNWVEAILWCQTNLQPGTWRYTEDSIEIDSDQDYTMFILSNKNKV